MIVRKVKEVRHSHIDGWLEFQLEVDWEDDRGREVIPFTYNPADSSPLTKSLKANVVPSLTPGQILPKKEVAVQ